MSLLFRNHAEGKNLRNSNRLKSLQEKVKIEKEKLINEQIRGELITWRQDFLYLSRIINSNDPDKECHVRFAVDECINDITHYYSHGEFYPEFCEGMREVEQRIEKKIISILPLYKSNPRNCLQQLAYSGQLKEIISFIRDLEQVFMTND